MHLETLEMNNEIHQLGDAIHTGVDWQIGFHFIKWSSQPRLAVNSESSVVVTNTFACSRIILRDKQSLRARKSEIQSNKSSFMSSSSAFLPPLFNRLRLDLPTFFIVTSLSFWLHHSRILYHSCQILSSLDLIIFRCLNGLLLKRNIVWLPLCRHSCCSVDITRERSHSPLDKGLPQI